MLHIKDSTKMVKMMERDTFDMQMVMSMKNYKKMIEGMARESVIMQRLKNMKDNWNMIKGIKKEKNTFASGVKYEGEWKDGNIHCVKMCTFLKSNEY